MTTARNVLITGFTGNFGPHLNELFKNDNLYVVSSRPPPADLGEDFPRIKWIQANLSQPDEALKAVKEAVGDTKIDVGFFAAAKMYGDEDEMNAIVDAQLGIIGEEQLYAPNARIITIGSTLEYTDDADIRGTILGGIIDSIPPDDEIKMGYNTYARSKGNFLKGIWDMATKPDQRKFLHLSPGFLGFLNGSQKKPLPDLEKVGLTKHLEAVLEEQQNIIKRTNLFTPISGAIKSFIEAPSPKAFTRLVHLNKTDAVVFRQNGALTWNEELLDSKRTPSQP